LTYNGQNLNLYRARVTVFYRYRGSLYNVTMNTTRCSATPAGAPSYRFVAAIELSTADPTATARGFKSANSDGISNSIPL
jgi:hypothetical protein